MEPSDNPSTSTQDLPGYRTAGISLPQLVGQVYATAPAPERRRLLEFLMRPLGVLALIAVADGIFARIRFGSGWPDPHVALEDANLVQAGDIAQLVDRVQMVSIDAIDGLTAIVASSPMIASSAAAAILVAMLAQRQHARHLAQQQARLDPDLDPLMP